MIKKATLILRYAFLTLVSCSTFAAECPQQSIALNSSVTGRLESGDCLVSDVLDSNDTSFVDVYSLTLESALTVESNLTSTEIDAFLRITDESFNVLFEDDDSGSDFNARISANLSAGTYKFLTNSATASAQTGGYTLALEADVPPVGSSRLINIATRAEIGTGDNVLIGGLIIGGDSPKTVLVRAIGPALAEAGVEGALLDPQIRLYNGSTEIDFNDDWSDHAMSSAIPAHLQPRFPLESAILATLDPGAYTAILTGLNESTGVGLVEIYEVDGSESATLRNIATRGRVGTGHNVMIGGVVISGNAPKTVLIRALGPSLGEAGVSGTLPDPVLQLFDSTGSLLETNDSWQDGSGANNIPDHLRPSLPNEAAIYRTMNPGAYTAIVSGAGGATGIAIVEVYEL